MVNPIRLALIVPRPVLTQRSASVRAVGYVAALFVVNLGATSPSSFGKRGGFSFVSLDC